MMRNFFLALIELMRNSGNTMSKTTLLTLPLNDELHRKFHEVAKKNKTNARNLGAMVIELAINDIESGKLNITQPSLEKGGL